VHRLTGARILMGDKKRTHEIFGEFIDRYTIREAEDDGAIVPILYEGRTAHGAVKDGASLDDLFEDLFREHTPEELEAIKAKYATKGQIFEAPDWICDGRDMPRHYVTNILPNGFGPVVASPAGGRALPGCLHRRTRRAVGRGPRAEPRGQGP
jgi:type I restriction enzyme R subunit